MKPIARKSDLLIEEDTGELFIHDLRNANAICLNPTSAYVWQKCDGKKESSEIALGNAERTRRSRERKISFLCH